MKAIFACFFAVALAHAKPLDCGENEEKFVKDCAVCFQTTCDGDLSSDRNVICTFMRFCPEETKGNAICICKQGFVRKTSDFNSPCVPKDQCPAASMVELERRDPTVCGDNEMKFVKDCSICWQNTCDGDLSQKEPVLCTLQRFCPKESLGSSICICNPGFVRKNNHPDAPCVLKSQCKAHVTKREAKCGDNEELLVKDCSICIQNSCEGDISRKQSAICTLQSVCPQHTIGQTICVCKPGFVRRNRNPQSPCVPKSQCPAKLACPPNEENFLVTCKLNKCFGGPTCAHPDAVMGCTLMYCPIDRFMCVCKKGFVREDGHCINRQDCKA